MVNESTFLSFSEFKDRYRFKPSFLSLLVVISAIKQLWETTNGKNLSELSDYNTLCEKVPMANKPNRIVYQKLVEKKRKQLLNSQMKWSADCKIEPNETVDWVAVYRKPFECTKISKRLVFQFKLFHRRLATNNLLKKINVIDNDLCSFCQREEESLIHLLWTCTVTSLFWEAFKEWLIRDKAFPTLDLSPSLVVGLKPQLMQNKIHYFLFLVARYYIWTCITRSQCPKIEGFHPFLSHYNPTTFN